MRAIDIGSRAAGCKYWRHNCELSSLNAEIRITNAEVSRHSSCVLRP